MARPFPLQAARDLAHRQEEQAAAGLRGHAGRLRAAEQKLAELESFRTEYVNQRASHLVEGIRADRLRAFDGFLARLDEALAVQRQECERQRALWESARQLWMDLHRRAEALDALAARHLEAELQAEGRREQKLLDEFSTRAAAAKARRT